jgi:hypothetical protein
MQFCYILSVLVKNGRLLSPIQCLLSCVPAAGNFCDFKKRQEEHVCIIFCFGGSNVIQMSV